MPPQDAPQPDAPQAEDRSSEFVLPEKTLSQKLDLNTIMFLELLPAELMEVIGEAYTDLARLEAAKSALKEGDMAPDFSLFDVRTGKVVSTASLRQTGTPIVLNFFRGGWCAYCTTELKYYQSLAESFNTAGATVVSVAPETKDTLKAALDKEEIQDLTVLSDSKLKIAQVFGLTFDLKPKLIEAYKKCGIDVAKANDMDTCVLPIPATYVIGTDGKILYSFVDCDPSKRAEPLDVLASIVETPDPFEADSSRSSHGSKSFGVSITGTDSINSLTSISSFLGLDAKDTKQSKRKRLAASVKKRVSRVSSLVLGKNKNA